VPAFPRGKAERRHHRGACGTRPASTATPRGAARRGAIPGQPSNCPHRAAQGAVRGGAGRGPPEGRGWPDLAAACAPLRGGCPPPATPGGGCRRGPIPGMLIAKTRSPSTTSPQDLTGRPAAITAGSWGCRAADGNGAHRTHHAARRSGN
jgi:hypothetical protein